MKKLKEKQGITLISLVITIVVLLILAGVSIAMLTGNNGILTQAQKAKSETEKSSEEELRRLTELEAATNLENTTYEDKNGQTAPIPAGFAVSQVEGENVIEDGLVIIDSKGNEFVWIPVETPVSDTEANGTTNKAMAVKVGENYRGLLYDFTDNGSTVKDDCTTTKSSYREPDVVTDYDTTNYSSAGYSSLEEMKQGLQSEYDKMITSVSKYYGFYIGRYELGLDGSSNPTSKKAGNGITTADASNSETEMWYGLYTKCKEYAPEEGTKSVVSSMTWGSQYDAMMNWMQKNGIKVNTKGNNNIDITTGTSETDLLKNIYDLYGCHFEWTSEIYSTDRRDARRWHLWWQ